MPSVPLAKAKAKLGALVKRAGLGESVEITRRGKPVAKIVPIDDTRRQIDLAALRALTDTMPEQPMAAGEFVRMMRDGARY